MLTLEQLVEIAINRELDVAQTLRIVMALRIAQCLQEYDKLTTFNPRGE
jgi:hypothetical protein